MKTKLIAVLAAVLVAGVSQADDLTLLNGDFELNPGSYEAIISWGPNGACAQYANHPKPGHVPALGSIFAYYSAGLTETVGQVVTNSASGGWYTIEANKVYHFWSYAMGGGDDVGTLFYEIGYSTNPVSGVYTADTYLMLETNAFVLDGTWAEQNGVTYTTGSSGREIGQELGVRFPDAGSSDIWFDNCQLTVVPEPGVIAGLMIGGLLLGRRFRR